MFFTDLTSLEGFIFWYPEGNALSHCVETRQDFKDSFITENVSQRGLHNESEIKEFALD